MFNNNPFTGAFGLDFGDLSLKLVRLEPVKKWGKPSSFIIKDMSIVSLPPGYIVNGEIQQPEMVRQKLMLLLGKNGHGKKISSPWVVADLPEPKTFLTSIELEIPPEQITKEDIEYQCQKHLPIDLNETYIDWQTIKQTEKSKFTRVLIGAAAKTIADSYTYLLESTGLHPIALEIESLSIARSLSTNTVDQAGAILDLGATRSSIIIYDKGGVRFSTTINFSGELINTALIQQLKIDYKTAEEMKINNGLNYNKTYPNYLKIVDELVNGLVEDIKKTIIYYHDHHSQTTPIEQIDLCGGISGMQNLISTIARRLKIKCDLGNPWKNVNTKNMSAEQRKFGPTLVTATGLAMRATLNPYNE